MKLLFENWRKYLNEDLLTEKLLLKDGPNGWQLYGQLVADAYEAAPEYDPAAAPAFSKIEPFIEKMFQRILSKVDVEFVEYDPYPDPNVMCDDARNGFLKIFSGGTSHPIFSHENNLKFRAIHDYMSHCQPAGWSGTGFDQKGEIQAYNAHLHTIPPAAAPALFTEVVGQASYYLHRGNFPEQKIAFLSGFDYFNIGRVEGYNIIDKELIKL